MAVPYWNTLISVDALHQHLHDAHLVIIDCRFELNDTDAGRRTWQQAHIPGAQYAHLDHDLSGPITDTSGRHPLPEPRKLAETFSRWGIDSSKQVIAYDANTGAMAATRLWWLLRWLGHEHVAVLDGGLKQWRAAGFELTHSQFAPTPTSFKTQAHDAMLATADEVATRIKLPDWRVLDSRSQERYAGEVEPMDPVAGHIPGARNHPYSHNLDAEGRFLPAAQLRQQLQERLGAVAPHQTIIMCGSGITACHDLLAMEIAGLRSAKLYAGSWSEWCRAHNRPIATGRDEFAT